MNKQKPALILLTAALLALLGGLLFGTLGGVHYVLPGALREALPFAKLRPLHVSLVVFWLLLGASGCIYWILREQLLRTRLQQQLARVQVALVLAVLLGAVGCYSAGIFGGREYWEFPPLLAMPLALYWVLFGINFLIAARQLKRPWPIYYWQWLCGIGFFLFSLAESYLWLLPYFGNHIVRDMAVQWKSYGAIVGSWNMLIYGTAFYLMEKISGDAKIARQPLTFFFFFLGLFNLMFNWGHHIYVLPVTPAIKHVAYLVSMTELLILGKIIYGWRNSLSTAQKHFHRLPYRFLAAADTWIFLNLALAILMSVPAFNLYTHGTHVTVAHAMGTTIGINTMILLAAVYFVLGHLPQARFVQQLRKIRWGYWLANGGLLVFWLALIGAGIGKAWLQVQHPELPHGLLMQQLWPFFAAFLVSGVVILVGIVLMAVPLLRACFAPQKAAAPVIVSVLPRSNVSVLSEL